MAAAGTAQEEMMDAYSMIALAEHGGASQELTVRELRILVGAGIVGALCLIGLVIATAT
jgi:hypothetical protein